MQGFRGRGARGNPPNRFESIRLDVVAPCGDAPHTQVYRDRTRRVINPVDSPDVPFRWSINPYRGCEHGCVYCYARPDHERLGFSCGLDFETRIVAKPDAPALLRKELALPSWRGEMIAMSGVTDPYQPIEQELRIARGCLEVMATCRQPVGIVTKNRLILRDIELLQRLAAFDAVRVMVSVTTLDNKLAAKMEPRASSPADRLETIRRLSQAGVPTSVMVAPVVPGLTDREMPRILEAAAKAGAVSARYIMLRLPHQVKALFVDWLERHFPDRASHVASLLRQLHSGDLYQSKFGARQRGRGALARNFEQLFAVFSRRNGLDENLDAACSEYFDSARLSGQMSLF